ncbi:MAG: hypothetical protein P8Y23_02255 [Candidatus Lokiarchaeota archaeon]
MIIRLLEYESKELFKQFGIPLAESIVILRGENINEKIGNFKFPAIVKSQIAIGSRKKAGLIKVAQSKEEASLLCTQFFKKTVGNFSVDAVLIEKLVSIQHEYYCSIALDESGRQFYAITSKEGGIDIEEVSATNPEAIIKIPFSLRGGLSDEMAKTIAKKLDFSNEKLDAAVDIWKKLWKITHELEAQLVEINPLVLSNEGLIAVDGKMILDDDAVTMALIDVLSNIGLKPANFLDVGGGANKERVYKALELLIEINPKVILVNIFGGITRCDIVAEAIIQALQDFQNPPPIIIRLTGTMDQEGIKILNEHNINAFTNVMEAVKKVKEVLS